MLLHSVTIGSIVDSHSAVALARRAAQALGLDAAGKTRVAIAAGELATNIARHAKQGVVRIYGGRAYLKIVAEDNGPGIPDIARALLDGHSGGRQLGVDDSRREGIGCGLGAVKRLMDQLEIHSTPGTGTYVVAIKRVPGSSSA